MFAWRYAVDLGAYDRQVGVHVLGETYPGLNSYPDKLRETIAAPGRMTAPTVRLLIGLNRRGTVGLRVPVDAAAEVAVIWNDDVTVVRAVAGHGVVELAGLAPRRGTNTLEIRAPVGTVIAPIEVTAGPGA
jgi:hypothetical protein